MSSLEKLSFAKAELYGFGFADATFHLSGFKLLVLLLGYFLHPLLPILLEVAYAISNNTFT